MDAASVKAEPSNEETQEVENEDEIAPKPAEPHNGHDSWTELDSSDGSDISDFFDSETDSEPEWDSESESDDEEPSPPVSSASTASSEVWSDDARTANVCMFQLQPGLKEIAQSPVDFLNLMFQKPLFESLVKNINQHGTKLLNENRIRQWNDVTIKEFRIFLGLLLNVGTINTNVAADFWKQDRGIYLPKNYMTEKRFSIILKCLNFAEEISEKKNRMSKVSLIVNYFNNVMKNVVTPEKILCIDESMGPFYENLYLLTDQHSLVHKLLIYKGIDQDELEEMTKRERDELIHTRANDAVKNLLEDKLDVGHSLFMDSDYNSLGLAKFLVARNTHVTGTLKRKREGNPPEIIEKELNMNIDDKITKYNPDGISVMIWKESVGHHVVIISSEHGSEWREHVNKYNKSVKKPACVWEFKKYRDGVRTHDEMMADYYYLPEKLAWHKRVGIHILQMLFLNAYNLYKRYGEKPPLKRLLKFRQVVIGYLLSGGDSDSV
ncbi:piggyBac transposable element-derived protein 3-like [Cydia splendana]|uniref:piggyBac transposable element-derived protein 3-like n=1 Tax=Cydia splendana TaxID=1100963 RepID=UPI00300C81C2